tara:strand:- start:383 stop:889 length:507 start_codon:yes stop_codon:yes gene_type:complete
MKGEKFMVVQPLTSVPANFISPMTDEQSDAFQKYNSLEKSYHKPFNIGNPDIPNPLKNSPILRIIDERVNEWGNASISTSVALFIMSLSNNSSAAILWSYTLTVMYHGCNEMITMQHLTNEFPFGFPSNNGVSLFWAQQKNPDMPDKNLTNDVSNWTAKAHENHGHAV